MLSFFRNLFGSKPETPSGDIMLAYFLSELDVRTKWLCSLLPNDPFAQKILDEVQTGLAKITTELHSPDDLDKDTLWNDAYRLERLLALIEPQETLWPELKRRIGEAKQENLASVARLSAAADTAAPLVLDTSGGAPKIKDGGVNLVRAILVDTLEELHYSFEKKFYARPIQQQATYKIVYLGLIAFTLFLLPYIVFYYWRVSGKGFEWSYWTWLPLYSCLTAGLFGALFSRLLYLQSNWDVLSIGGLKDARDIWSIVLRGCVGMTGAVIVSFFLQSGVIAGGLFPDFNKIGMDEALYPSPSPQTIDPKNPLLEPLHIIYPSKSFALLVVWSFLAGFSERLVPSILQETENRIGKKT